MAGALSRIARRIAQGFTRPAYHGTRSAEILDDVLKPGEGTADRMLGPHFAADPRMTDAFTVGDYAIDPSAWSPQPGLTSESGSALHPGGNVLPVWLRGEFKRVEGDSQWGPLRSEILEQVSPDDFIEWYMRSRRTGREAPEELIRRYERGDPLLVNSRFEPLPLERVAQLIPEGIDPTREYARLRFQDPEMPRGMLPIYGYESPAKMIEDYDAYMVSNIPGRERAARAYAGKLGREGFSGIEYINQSPGETRGVADPRAYIVTDPSAVRSWFAEFDPDKSGRAGLGFAAGGLARAASYFSPDLGRIYEESVEFGREFPRANEDGPGDAARHAYAASRLARRYGPGRARLMGGLYEMLSLGADRRSTRMDEYNNEAGIGLAELEDAAARARIREMIERNQLETLPAGSGGGY